MRHLVLAAVVLIDVGELHPASADARHGFVHAVPPQAATLRLEQRQPVAGRVLWLSPAA